MTLAQRIERMRRARSLSQEKLAELAGLTQATISRIEQGITEEPRAPALRGIAKALGVSVDSLVGLGPAGREFINRLKTSERDQARLELMPDKWRRLSPERKDALWRFWEHLGREQEEEDLEAISRLDTLPEPQALSSAQGADAGPPAVESVPKGGKPEPKSAAEPWRRRKGGGT